MVENYSSCQQLCEQAILKPLTGTGQYSRTQVRLHERFRDRTSQLSLSLNPQAW